MSTRFTIGVNSIEKLKKIKSKNIANIYCGYVDTFSRKKWLEVFGIVNKRGEKTSICGRKQFKAFALEAEKKNINIFVTFNGTYIPEQYNWIMKAIDFVSSFKSVKGIIVTDIGLLLRLKKINYKKEIIISTISTVFNSSSVSFFKQFGIKRIVLDRQLKTDEVLSILNAHKDMDFEIFVTFANCLFVDGFCSLVHTMETERKNKKKFYNVYGNLTMCGLIYLLQMSKRYKVINNENNKYSINFDSSFKYFATGCNICKINKLKDFSDRLVYKIITRDSSSLFKNKFQIINFYLDELSNMKNDIDKEKLFNKIFNYPCDKTGCYANEKIL